MLKVAGGKEHPAAAFEAMSCLQLSNVMETCAKLGRLLFAAGMAGFGILKLFYSDSVSVLRS